MTKPGPITIGRITLSPPIIRYSSDPSWAAIQNEQEIQERIIDAYELLMNTRLVDYDLSVRCLNTLKANDIEILGDLSDLTETQFDCLRCMTPRTKKEVIELMNKKQISFKL